MRLTSREVESWLRDALNCLGIDSKTNIPDHELARRIMTVKTSHDFRSLSDRVDEGFKYPNIEFRDEPTQQTDR